MIFLENVKYFTYICILKFQTNKEFKDEKDKWKLYDKTKPINANVFERFFNEEEATLETLNMKANGHRHAEKLTLDKAVEYLAVTKSKRWVDCFEYLSIEYFENKDNFRSIEWSLYGCNVY